jgi:hypothetical protein
MDVRRALDESGQQNIKTVRGRGYLFTASVESAPRPPKRLSVQTALLGAPLRKSLLGKNMFPKSPAAEGPNSVPHNIPGKCFYSFKS